MLLQTYKVFLIITIEIKGEIQPKMHYKIHIYTIITFVVIWKPNQTISYWVKYKHGTKLHFSINLFLHQNWSVILTWTFLYLKNYCLFFWSMILSCSNDQTSIYFFYKSSLGFLYRLNSKLLLGPNKLTYPILLFLCPPYQTLIFYLCPIYLIGIRQFFF